MIGRCQDLVGATQQTVSNIADIAGRRSTSIAQVVGVDRPGVVSAESLVDSVGIVGVAELLEVILEVVRAAANHGRDLLLGVNVNISFSLCCLQRQRHSDGILYLRQSMLAWKAW